MSLAAPAWIGALAAVVLAVGAIITSIFAIMAVGNQSRQLRDTQAVHARLAELLPLQAEELRDSLRGRKRAQAAQVFIEVDRIPPSAGAAAAAEAEAEAEVSQGQPGSAPWRLRATVHNTSGQPIYDLYLIWQREMVRMGKPDRTGRLMPGSDASFERLGPEPADPPADPGSLGAFLVFRDAAGLRWAVREDGTLTDIVAPIQDTPADP